MKTNLLSHLSIITSATDQPLLTVQKAPIDGITVLLELLPFVYIVPRSKLTKEEPFWRKLCLFLHSVYYPTNQVHILLVVNQTAKVRLGELRSANTDGLDQSADFVVLSRQYAARYICGAIVAACEVNTYPVARIIIQEKLTKMVLFQQRQTFSGHGIIPRLKSATAMPVSAHRRNWTWKIGLERVRLHCHPNVVEELEQSGS